MTDIFKELENRSKKEETFDDQNWYLDKIDKKFALQMGREYFREIELYRLRLKYILKEQILNKTLMQGLDLDIFTANKMLDYMFNFDQSILEGLEEEIQAKEAEKK